MPSKCSAHGWDPINPNYGDQPSQRMSLESQPGELQDSSGSRKNPHDVEASWDLRGLKSNESLKIGSKSKSAS